MSQETQETQETQEKYNFSDFDGILDFFKSKLNDEDSKKILAQHIENLIKEYEFQDNKIIFLYDKTKSISTYHSNEIYTALKDSTINENLVLILLSDGGSIEPAYLISKTCKRLTGKKFIVAIPRQAKSAATLISLGADEIHMGLLSELGPIDPQFGGLPALGLSNALEKIAQLSEAYPKSSKMFAKFLISNVNIRHLGYYERINESAMQYAERLLEGKEFAEDQTPYTLANHFTNHYKDHSFVIDADEAKGLLGEHIIKEFTKEYEFANKVHEFFNVMDTLYRYFYKKELRCVGNIETGIGLNETEE